MAALSKRQLAGLLKRAKSRLGTRAKAARPRGSASPLEAKLALIIRAAGLPPPQREFFFHPKRQWRFDFAWPAVKLAVEVEGGIWTGGRHVTGAGFAKDCEKYAEAAMLGWRVIRVVDVHLNDGKALAWIQRALGVTPAALELAKPPGRTPAKRKPAKRKIDYGPGKG